MSEYTEAQKTMWSNAVSVRIYPIDLPNQPMSEWEWNAEITIPNNQWENSDEDGNFTIDRGGIDAFSSLQEAFEWTYKWLSSRGYDVSNIDINMNSCLDNGFIKKSDLAKVVEEITNA